MTMRWGQWERRIVLAMAMLIAASLVALASAKPELLARQAAWVGVGLLTAVLAMRIGYQRWIEAAYVCYGLALALLVLVLVGGEVRQGAQRWIALGPITMQPAELAKLSLILCLARWLGHDGRDQVARWRGWWLPLLLLGVLMAFLIEQPDLGSALLLVPLALTLLWVAGCRARHLATIVALGLLAAPFAWEGLREYQRQRLLVFLNPHIDPLGAGYTVIQSKIAIGSGQLWGKGWLAGTQNQLNFLPERHTDFIFSVIGEEWGFAGAAVLVWAFWLLIRACWAIGKEIHEPAGRLVAIGMASWFGYQACINMGMAMGWLPVVGLPLPLVSYGGSSLVTSMAGLGVVLSLRRR